MSFVREMLDPAEVNAVLYLEEMDDAAQDLSRRAHRVVVLVKIADIFAHVGASELLQRLDLVGIDGPGRRGLALQRHQSAEMARRQMDLAGVDAEIVAEPIEQMRRRPDLGGEVAIELGAIDAERPADVRDRRVVAAEAPQIVGEVAQHLARRGVGLGSRHVPIHCAGRRQRRSGGENMTLFDASQA